MGIAQNIRRLRESRGLTQEELGKIANVSSMAVSQWENGRAVPRMGAVQRMADHFGISKGEIIDEGAVPTARGGYTEIPLYGSIAAGDPIEMCPLGDERCFVPDPVAERWPGAFALRVRGDSMDRVLPDGCNAVVNPCETVEHPGKPYAVCVNGHDATIKRVRPLANGLELSPDSTDPTYRPQVFDFDDPGCEQVRIIGEVVYYVLPLDWGF